MSDMTDLLDIPDGDYDFDVPWRGMFQYDEDAAVTASVIPVKPPKSWFDNPELKQLSPLTITATGQVYGHVAAWHTSHIGLAGGIKPPRSKSNYQYFRTGVVETDSGDMVDVGQITLTGGHAPLEASVAKAVAHYDDTNSAVMDVAAGEDKHGIWVAGALRPGVTDEQIRTIRASSVSGDWRPISGRLELVAICAVNCPGFPIPRARVASGMPIALVAAGVEPLVQRVVELQMGDDMKLGLESFNQRVSHLEKVIIAHGVGTPDASELAEDLRRRVYGDQDPAEVESVNASIEVDEAEDAGETQGTDEETPVTEETPVEEAPAEEAPAEEAPEVDEAVLASLRAQVHGPLIADLRRQVHGA